MMASQALAAPVFGLATVILYSAISLILYVFYTAVYRLFLSPLAQFPGPKLAALTFAYEGYYQCFKDGGGRYYVEINKMHDKYGPIVRINPLELHVRDPEWNEIFKFARRTNKPHWFYCFLGSTGNTFASESWEVHRRRRDALQSYFTPAVVGRYHGRLEELVDQLLQRLRAQKGRIVRLDDALRCLATDVATGFAFGEPFGHLDSPDFEHVSNGTVRTFGTIGLANRQLGGWLMPALRRVTPAASVSGFFKRLQTVIDDEVSKGTRSDNEEFNVIQQILRSDLPAAEKTPWRVAREASSITLAGTETTGGTMAATSFLLLSHPEKLATLKQELGNAEVAVGRKLSYQELRDLPYLTGVINEGFRIHGLSARLPRYDPVEDMTYRSWRIPKGTTVSTSQVDTHMCAEIFTDPRAFLPERWLDPVQRNRLSKYLLPWGRGRRICLGLELATMEFYLAMGRLFSPSSGLDMEICDTSFEEDVDLFHDYFSPFPKSLKGIRVSVS